MISFPESEILAPCQIIEQRSMRDGNGSIYKAQNTKTGDLVAIKLLWSHFQTTPEIVQSFLHEVQFIPVLQHPNVLPIYEGGILKMDSRTRSKRGV